MSRGPRAEAAPVGGRMRIPRRRVLHDSATAAPLQASASLDLGTVDGACCISRHVRGVADSLYGVTMPRRSVRLRLRLRAPSGFRCGFRCGFSSPRTEAYAPPPWRVGRTRGRAVGAGR